MTLDLTRPLPDDLSNEGALRRFLLGLAGVDEVGVAQRVAELASRSIKADAKKWALHQIVAMLDLTTLEGRDTPGKVRSMCAKAARPDPPDPDIPAVAAVCVYPDLVGVAAESLRGSGVRVPSVTTGFPAGRTSLEVKLLDTKPYLTYSLLPDR